MKITLRRPHLIAILGVCLAILSLIAITGESQAGPTVPKNPSASDAPTDWSQAREVFSENLHQILPYKLTAAALPPPEEDACLHCHLTGEEKGLWTPLVRWILFGGAGLIFAFGIYRSSSVWVTREPWKPFLSRTADWFDTRYEISDPLFEQTRSKFCPPLVVLSGRHHRIFIRRPGPHRDYAGLLLPAHARTSLLQHSIH